MLDLALAADGRVSRRSFVRVGSLGVAGLSWPHWLRSVADDRKGAPSRADAVIQVYLSGGPSHLESYDPKPDAPAEYRGELRPIATRLPGLILSECLPRQALIADRLVVVRGLHHGRSDHAEGTHWILTGHEPGRASPRENERPSTGSVVARFGPGSPRGLPRYVTVPDAPAFAGAAELGPAFNPFTPVGDLASGAVRVANLDPPPGVDRPRLDDRRRLLADLDRLDRRRDAAGVLAGRNRFTEEAYAMIAGPAARAAFDLDREPATRRERYGRTPIGQGCLLARRLVEAGVPFVTVHDGDWDHHGRVFESCRRQLPAVDAALSALIEDLVDRDLFERVLVLVWGEFGRTPRVNGQAGRDHWPGAFSAVLAGGGLRGGLALGATDRRGEAPVERPVSPEDVLATVYDRLGIDPGQSTDRRAGRPTPILGRGAPIREILA